MHHLINMRFTLSVLAAAAITTSFISPARAGCCRASGSTLLNVGTSDQAVPTNALVRLDYILETKQTCPPRPYPKLFEDGCCRTVSEAATGAVVEGTWEQVPSEVGHVTVVFKPDKAYEPATEYVVRDKTLACWRDADFSSPSPTDAEKKAHEQQICEVKMTLVDPVGHFEQRFRTGLGPDSTPPTLAGAPVIHCRSFTFERGAQCDVVPDEMIEAHGFEFRVSGMEGADPSLAGLRLYVRRQDNAPWGSGHDGPLSFLSRPDCACGGDQPQTRLPTDGESYIFAVRAVDIAGNLSETELTIPWSRTDCKAESETASPDKGAGEAGGCAYVRAPPVTSAEALALPLLLLAFVWRRRAS